MLGIPSAIGTIQLIGLSFVPESPRWLAGHGKIEEAKKVNLIISSYYNECFSNNLKVLLKISENAEVAESMFEHIIENINESGAERAAAG